MASSIGSSKRKAEENVENEDKSAKRQFIKQEVLDDYIKNVNENFDNQNSENMDEQNCSNSSNSEPPEIEFDEKSWNKTMSDNDESHVSEPWPGGMFSNQVGTSLCGGYNLPPALNEIELMYSPRYSDGFEQEEAKNTPKSRDSNNEVIDNNSELEIVEDKIQSAQSYEEQNLESNQKNSNTDEEKPLKAPAPSVVAPTSGQTRIFPLNLNTLRGRSQTTFTRGGG